MDDVKRPPELPKAEESSSPNVENKKPVISDVVPQKSESQAHITEAEQATETDSDKEIIKPELASNEQQAPKPKKKRNFLPIALAVIIMSCLIGLAVYAGLFIKDKDNTSNQSSNNSSTATRSDNSSQSANTATDSKKEINNAIKEINNISDEDDTSGSNLNDQSLGL